MVSVFLGVATRPWPKQAAAPPPPADIYPPSPEQKYENLSAVVPPMRMTPWLAVVPPLRFTCFYQLWK